MTFPFSTHNYQLRFWMAAGGVDPDEDVRLVVLPPPYMVESLANGQVDAFCVGAPWNSVAVDLGVGRILHFVSEILPRAAEKVLAVRDRWAQENPDVLRRLLRAHARAAAFVADAANREEVTALLAAPNRIAVDPDTIRRTLEGRLKIAADGTTRVSERYLHCRPRGAGRPDPAQAAWLFAQMVRWGQAPHVGRNAAPRRRPCSAPISSTKRCRTKPAARRPNRPTASAPLPAPPSTATTLLRTSPPRTSDAGELRFIAGAELCIAQFFCRIASEQADRRPAREHSEPSPSRSYPIELYHFCTLRGLGTKLE